MIETAKIKKLFVTNLPLFSALGDSKRQQILLIMADNYHLSVAELAAQTNLSRPAVSHHLKVLKDAGLVSDKKEGTKHFYFPTVHRYSRAMREMLDEIDRLETHATKKKGE